MKLPFLNNRWEKKTNEILPDKWDQVEFTSTIKLDSNVYLLSLSQAIYYRWREHDTAVPIIVVTDGIKWTNICFVL